MRIKTKSEKCLIFLTAFFLLFFWCGVNTNAHESTAENTAVIHVDEKGFEPSILTIKVGAEVLFENVGKEDHWPASDDHPSHTLYDGTSMEEHCDDTIVAFDSCGAIKPEDMWSFVFEREGSFGFHDHLSPHLGGTIIVKEAGKNIFGRFLNSFKKFFKRFRENTNKETDVRLRDGDTGNEFYLELKDRFKDITLNKTPNEALALLEEESLRDENVYALCHDVLHEIGRVAYGKYKSFGEATQFQSDFCNSGYLHGVFEAYFRATENPYEKLAEQCDKYASKTGRAFDLWQCYHGAGHGFMYFTAGDLDLSLLLCKQSFGEVLGIHCQNGAFMEIFNLEILAKEKGFVDPDNPLLVCAERESKSECYPYAALYFHYTKKIPFADIFEECNRAEFGHRNKCAFGVGAEAMKRNMNNFDSVLNMCLDAKSDNYRKACLSGAVRMYVMNGSGEVAEGLNLCTKVPEEYGSMCRNSIGDLELFFKQILHFEKI